MMDRFYDTPPPLKPVGFSNERFMALLETSKDATKILSPMFSLFAKDDQTMTSGWQGAPYFSQYRREMASKPAISSKNNRGLSNNDSMNPRNVVEGKTVSMLRRMIDPYIVG